MLSSRGFALGSASGNLKSADSHQIFLRERDRGSCLRLLRLNAPCLK
jgi:hypothetical protein